MKIPLRQYWLLLVNYLKPQWLRVVILALLLFSSIGLHLLSPQILRYFIDTAVKGGPTQNLVTAAMAFLGVAAITQLLEIGATYTSENVGWNATNALRNDLAEHCLQLDMPFHNTHTPGVLIERIDGDITALASFFSQFVVKILGNMLLLTGALILISVEDWRMGLALTVFAIVAVWVLNLTRNMAVPRSKAEREVSAQLYGFIEERLAGTEDIRANGAEGYTMLRLHESFRSFFLKTRRSFMMFSLLYFIITCLFTFGYVLTLGMSAYLFVAGSITLGTVYLFYQYTEMLRHPLEQMTRQMQELQKASAGILRVQELYNIKPQIQDGRGSRIPAGPLSVEFKDVSFGYNDNEFILENINLKLEPGKVLGLLGRTGSGKTTVSRLLFRLYEVTQGELLVGGVDVKDTTLNDLRRKVGMVTQEVQLFQATVRDNLTFFDRSISDERIIGVIRELGLNSWFDALPDGLDSELKSGGSGLSAGEAQLLAFTRLFLEDSGLIVLDEASSRLDPATESMIEHAVDKLLQNRTGLIIAHRLATVQRADEIMILEDSRVVEYGPRLLLAADPDSRFYNLLQAGLEETLV